MGMEGWPAIEGLLDRGDPAFVDALRRVDDPEALAAFAERWYEDTRPGSRRLLLEYLGRPLNAYRHEPLVKRLFKRAEGAGDDEVMARFLVLFDRSVRRARVERSHLEVRRVGGRGEAEAAAAEALMAEWRAQGFERVGVWPDRKKGLQVWGIRTETTIRASRTTVMPRGAIRPTPDRSSWSYVTGTYRSVDAPDWVAKLGLPPDEYAGAAVVPEAHRAGLERFRLFATATRHYLRRRCWRYFRAIGRRDPGRYVAAASRALLLYRDEDVADPLALLDNWGLVHILFHHRPLLSARPGGWQAVEGPPPEDIEPAPAFGPLWDAAPRAVADLLTRAESRVVRRWAGRLARRNLPAFVAAIPTGERIGWLSHADPEVVEVAAETLRDDPAFPPLVARDEIEGWLSLAEQSAPEALAPICGLLGHRLDPGLVPLERAARLAEAPRVPLARLGFDLLRAKSPRGEHDARTLLGLAGAEAAPIRAELVRWARETLGGMPEFRGEWILPFLESPYPDVRAEGWAWLVEDSRLRDDLALWSKVLEIPHDDIRQALTAELEARASAPEGPGTPEGGGLDALRASVLLDLLRGGRAGATVVRRLCGRLDDRPDELEGILPILAVALRAARGNDRRAGIAALVRLVGSRPEAGPSVRRALPEFSWD